MILISSQVDSYGVSHKNKKRLQNKTTDVN